MIHSEDEKAYVDEESSPRSGAISFEASSASYFEELMACREDGGSKNDDSLSALRRVQDRLRSKHIKAGRLRQIQSHNDVSLRNQQNQHARGRRVRSVMSFSKSLAQVAEGATTSEDQPVKGSQNETFTIESTQGSFTSNSATSAGHSPLRSNEAATSAGNFLLPKNDATTSAGHYLLRANGSSILARHSLLRKNDAAISAGRKLLKR